MKKRIALVGYPVAYFGSFAAALEGAGFEVFWVHSIRSEALRHIREFAGASNTILDSTEGFAPDLSQLDSYRAELAALESPDGPRIHDIILMDRVLRKKSYGFAVAYLAHLQRVLRRFFLENAIGLVSSGRDTALQLMGMLVCKSMNIPWVVPTRLRIPQEMYMFAEGHETEQLVSIRDVNEDDLAWAREFLNDFRSQPIKPAVKMAATSYIDVLRMLPRHGKLFSALLKNSVIDRWNSYSRYTIIDIIAMYLRRRINMGCMKIWRPYGNVGGRPFCLYAMHTQPESSIDVAGSYFSNQIELVKIISRSIPVSHDLYVKIHPTDVDGRPAGYYQQLRELPGVVLIGHAANTKDLIRSADLTFTLTGTIGYEAGLLGRKVITFGRNFYNSLPTVHYCDAPPKLPELVASVLGTDPGDVTEQTVQVLADLKSKAFPGEVNRMFQSRQLSADDLSVLQAAYSTLFEVMPGRVAGLQHA